MKNTAKNTEKRICANYAKPCSIANRCDNCRNRALHNARDPLTGSNVKVIRCRKGNDTEGDKTKCFECSSEGYRCKADE